MKFIIRAAGGVIPKPEFKLGPPGKQLACYIPADIPWRQLNYGQGEGQVLIEGREWGFYWTQSGNLAVVLHDGEIDADTAIEFVRRVARTVYTEGSAFAICLKGEEDRVESSPYSP